MGTDMSATIKTRRRRATGRHAPPGGLGAPIALAGLLGLAAALAAAGPVWAETEVYEAPRATTIPAFEEPAALQVAPTRDGFLAGASLRFD